MTTAYGPRPETEHRPTIEIVPLDRACLTVSRARDGRAFACSRPIGHGDVHYGQDRTGPVRLGFGR